MNIKMIAILAAALAVGWYVGRNPALLGPLNPE